MAGRRDADQRRYLLREGHLCGLLIGGFTYERAPVVFIVWTLIVLGLWIYSLGRTA